MSDPKKTIRFIVLRRFLASATIVIGISLSLLHFFQFDQLAAVTLIPPWLLLIPALFVLVVTARATSRTSLVVLIAVISIFAGMFVEELRSLARVAVQSATERENHLRIVTLNCNCGSAKAAREVMAMSPDIVLLQESPGSSTINELATEFFGEHGTGICGGDTSIIINGTLTPVHVDRSSHFVHAVATLSDGRKIDLISLRLSAPVFRIDFLSGGFWQDHLATRLKHRQQLATIRNHLEGFAQTDIARSQERYFSRGFVWAPQRRKEQSVQSID